MNASITSIDQIDPNFTLPSTEQKKRAPRQVRKKSTITIESVDQKRRSTEARGRRLVRKFKSKGGNIVSNIVEPGARAINIVINDELF